MDWFPSGFRCQDDEIGVNVHVFVVDKNRVVGKCGRFKEIVILLFKN